MSGALIRSPLSCAATRASDKSVRTSASVSAYVLGVAADPRDRFFEPGIHWRRTYRPAQLRLRAMKIGVPKETAPGEQRVALVPDGVRRQTESGVDVLVETGAGEAAAYPDATYTDAGAQIVSADDLYAQADLVLRIGKVDGAGALRNGQTLVAFLQPLVETELAKALAERGVTSFSMDAIPRITRAQPMDALSSQATVAGYKAVLIAAGSIGKFFPMLTTAAGTIRPAKVMVLGAGVAGLQAIATARRLGAVVSAYDVRPAVKEQVESLGATFLELDVEGAEGVGGYAIALAEDEQARQQELLKLHAAAVGCRDLDRAHPGQARAAPPHRGGRGRDAAGLGDRRPRRRDGRQLRRNRGGRARS